ncbi:cytochrome c biogenesis CcdA family protein [Pseudanabaena yagii]|uniref:Cytochrome c biogenesis protein CcdA n=1 Tax=Pseudanabaena yagii GIHE-NHR1 TaxID=2722753 RepID=A0ABX1LU88_9CYAN|nr:cytochrome c biogenesis protein CcdA [Pseudanabaena yagii]NMF59722.1 cytochrome c biogenesis protein CcdA [Pseudanabaena yagii GIHE-NHR1]
MSRIKKFIQVSSKTYFGRFLIPFLLCIATIIAAFSLSRVNWTSLFQPFQNFVFETDDKYHNWFSQQSITNPFLLLPLAFIGGLVASISPCVLALLPVNLSYIGTREITSKREALIKAGTFVLGVVTVLSILGLFSSIASLITLKYQGYIHTIVGTLILLMGLSLWGVFRLPLPQKSFRFPALGCYGIGLTFALLSSPCTSPILFSILAAAATSGSQLYSVLAMVSYALGYTIIIFLASLFTGLAKQARSLMQYSEIITRIGSAGLILMGGFYLINGIQWIVAISKL